MKAVMCFLYSHDVVIVPNLPFSKWVGFLGFLFLSLRGLTCVLFGGVTDTALNLGALLAVLSAGKMLLDETADLHFVL